MANTSLGQCCTAGVAFSSGVFGRFTIFLLPCPSTWSRAGRVRAAAAAGLQSAVAAAARSPVRWTAAAAGSLTPCVIETARLKRLCRQKAVEVPAAVLLHTRRHPAAAAAATAARDCR